MQLAEERRGEERRGALGSTWPWRCGGINTFRVSALPCDRNKHAAQRTRRLALLLLLRRRRRQTVAHLELLGGQFLEHNLLSVLGANVRL